MGSVGARTKGTLAVAQRPSVLGRETSPTGGACVALKTAVTKDAEVEVR
jgi:hypothetical protein